MGVKHPQGTDLPHLIGGFLCLDFVNTVDPRHAVDRVDYIQDYEALLAWAIHAGVVEPDDANGLRKASVDRSAAAAKVVQRSHHLREALYQILTRYREGRPPSQAGLSHLNGEMMRAGANARVVGSEGRFALHWNDNPLSLDRVLWPIARSSADLLVNGPINRVRECSGNGDCGWLFIDSSKNSSRRWCEMRSCGNRAKARRRYERYRSRSR